MLAHIIMCKSYNDHALEDIVIVYAGMLANRDQPKVLTENVCLYTKPCANREMTTYVRISSICKAFASTQSNVAVSSKP